QVLTLCPRCGGILDTEYDLERVSEEVNLHKIEKRPNTMWRWREFLPVKDQKFMVTANEGGTPLIRAEKLANKFSLKHLYIKDETRNPTGTFKDRGASSAISKLKELGVGKVAIASEGNAACSCALYSLLAQMECYAYIPEKADAAKKELIKVLGAELRLVEGTIADAGKTAEEEARKRGYYNCGTFVTPFRHDGKGTMAFEIAEQMSWEVPDAIVYPTGGGVGLVGMWKAFKIMKQLDWASSLPKMFSAQASGCAPIVKAFHDGKEEPQEWEGPKTVASGLEVPKPLAGPWILRVIRESGGSATAVTDAQALEFARLLLKAEGLLVEPSSAVAFAALKKFRSQGEIDGDERVVVIATGSGLKTLERYMRI
ncbi:MAG: threonine synthase, partial [Candidatus Bathyarchaeia archaeon]